MLKLASRQVWQVERNDKTSREKQSRTCSRQRRCITCIQLHRPAYILKIGVSVECHKAQTTYGGTMETDDPTLPIDTYLSTMTLPGRLGCQLKSIIRTSNARRFSQLQRLSRAEQHEVEANIRKLAHEEQRPISLERLVKFSDMVPIPEDVLLENGKEVIHEVAVRLAHRLHALRNLDYLIVLNPHISKIYSVYFNSFRVISTTPGPTSLEENTRFVQVLERLVESHSNTIPVLAKGFFEARRYMSTEESSEILDRHLRARIGTRLIAEHHIALTNPVSSNFIGTIQKDCCPGDIVRECAVFVGEMCDLKYGVVPHVVIDQGANVKIPYVPVHMEYVFTELLKNAFRAVVENGKTSVPVYVTIIRTGQGVIIRFRDRGGGIAPKLQNKVFEFAFSTVEEYDDTGSGSGGDSGLSAMNSGSGGMPGSTLAGLGYGLPLSRAYAEFFGGSLQIESYHGWGTDVYVTLNSPAGVIRHRNEAR